jgi:hypothetical protein
VSRINGDDKQPFGGSEAEEKTNLDWEWKALSHVQILGEHKTKVNRNVVFLGCYGVLATGIEK